MRVARPSVVTQDEEDEGNLAQGPATGHGTSIKEVDDKAVIDEASGAANQPVHAPSQTRLKTSDIAREAKIAGIVLKDEPLDLSDEALGLSEQSLVHDDSTITEVDLQGAPLPANSVTERRLESMRPQSAAFESERPQSAAMEDAHLVVSTLFGAIAGYVDTVGFLALFGMFTAHITGDLVASLAELPQGSVTTRVLMLPIFMISVAVTTVFARATRRYSDAPLFPLLALMTVALLVFGATGIVLRPFMTSHSNWAVSIVGAIGVGAMAIQNMIMRDALNSWTPTTIMTGNLTQVTIQLVELAFAAREGDPQRRARIHERAVTRLVKFGLPLVGFVTGAVSGAMLTRLYGFWSIALPAAVVGALTVWHWRHGRLR